MSPLKNLTSDASIANEKDSVGGGGVLDTDLYPSTVSMAYITKSVGGAIGLVLNAKTQTGREIRQTLWMSSGDAKGNKNYYEKDGQKTYLPGFIAANALTLLAAGKEISEMDTETKLVKVYNKEAKADVPTKVEVLVDLLGKEIIIGLIKQVVDKTAKNDAGIYVATGESREENEIDKFFRASDKMTTTEIRASATEPSFYNTWSEKWRGQVKNKAKGAAEGGAAVPGMPKMAGAGISAKKPSTSLFA
jgi:hypothetical protein